jgi:hypothetical protein
MTRNETAAGTPVVGMTPEEYSDFLESEVRSRADMSLDEFERRYRDGALDDADPDVELLAVLIGAGQNGHQVAA